MTYAGRKAFLDGTGFPWGGDWWAIDRRWHNSVPFAGQRYTPVLAYPPEMAAYPNGAVSQTETLA